RGAAPHPTLSTLRAICHPSRTRLRETAKAHSCRHVEEQRMQFKAVLVEKTDAGQSVALKELGLDALMEGDVLVRVSHSPVNYKDGLALPGKAPVVRRFPMVPGIDLAGVVETSSHAD